MERFVTAELVAAEVLAKTCGQKFSKNDIFFSFAVTVDPFRPNPIPFESENVTAERLLLSVPAESLIAVNDVATDAVIVLPFRPNDTLLPFEKLI